MKTSEFFLPFVPVAIVLYGFFILKYVFPLMILVFW